MEPGMTIENYTVQKVLYSGTRSHLYLVTHPDLNDRFVLKAPSINFAEDAQYLEGFMREEWVGRRVDNKGVMKILSKDDKSKFLYHLCEYIEGKTLRQWMYDNPQPPLEKVRTICQGIIQSLRAFQRLGMVHRDLKPENIFVLEGPCDEVPSIRVLDFGLAFLAAHDGSLGRLTQEGILGGTPAYMSPEQAQAEPLTAATDIYSLGCVLYEMAAGEVPFVGNVPETLARHVYVAPVELKTRKLERPIPDSLAELIGEMMSKPATKRPAPSQVAERLRAL